MVTQHSPEVARALSHVERKGSIVIPKGTVILICCKAKEHRAFSQRVIVARSGRDAVVAQCRDSISLPNNTAVELYYHDEKQQFVSTNAVINEIQNGQDRTSIRLVVDGQLKHADKRSSYRVSMRGCEAYADLDAQLGCEVIDVGLEGVCLRVGDRVPVEHSMRLTLYYDETVLTGMVIVRNCIAMDDGGYRCGVQAENAESNLARELKTLAMSVQRNELKRRSRVSSKGNTGAADARAGADGDAAPSAYLRLHVPRELLKGKPLPGSINDEQGDSLARAGQSLSAEDIELLSQQHALHIGQDWLSAPRATADVKPERRKNERREHPRVRWVRNAIISSLNERGNKRMKVTTKDLSQSGFSFAARFYVHVGTEIQAQFEHKGVEYEIHACVRNCDLGEDGMYRVGLQFMQSQLQVRSQEQQQSTESKQAPAVK